jgi:K+-sensing histidine kinase KdpD
MTQLKRVWASLIRTGPGCFLLALITFVCYRLQLNLTVTGFIYLIAIVLQSLIGNFISSAVVSVVAVLCLDFFFTPPRFSLEVTSPRHTGADFVLDYGSGRVSTHHPSARGGSDLGPPAASGGPTVPAGANATGR